MYCWEKHLISPWKICCGYSLETCTSNEYPQYIMWIPSLIWSNGSTVEHTAKKVLAVVLTAWHSVWHFNFITCQKQRKQDVLVKHKHVPRARSIFLWSRSQVKVKVTVPNFFVWVGSPCHKEPTCQIWRLYLKRFKSYNQCYFFLK